MAVVNIKKNGEVMAVLVDIVVEFVVGSESEEHPETRPEREIDLRCRVHPHLDSMKNELQESVRT